VPGATAEGELTQYKDCAPYCAHCRTIRQRTDTFLVRNADSREIKQVGRQCLRDFLGHENPEHLCAMAELLIDAVSALEDAEEGGFSGNFASGDGSRTRFGLHAFLVLTACRIREHGWLSRGKAREEFMGRLATADMVLDAIDHARKCRGAACSQIEDHLHPTEQDTAAADAALEWARAIPESAEDYLYNVRVLARGESFNIKHAGIVASIISSYQRNQAKERERAQLIASSEHVGEIGKRQDFPGLKLIRAIPVDGYWGLTIFYKLEDAEGNRITWKASSWADMEEGDTVTLKATVKEHGEWQGVAETYITRCKVLTREPAQPVEIAAAEGK
jgi:hypothetical protein